MNCCTIRASYNRSAHFSRVCFLCARISFSSYSGGELQRYQTLEKNLQCVAKIKMPVKLLFNVYETYVKSYGLIFHDKVTSYLAQHFRFVSEIMYLHWMLEKKNYFQQRTYHHKLHVLFSRRIKASLKFKIFLEHRTKQPVEHLALTPENSEKLQRTPICSQYVCSSPNLDQMLLWLTRTVCNA